MDYPLLKKAAGAKWVGWAREFEKLDDPSQIPLLLKKKIKQGLEPYWSELADYEWSLAWVSRQENQMPPKTTKRLAPNPLTRILQLNYNIRAWVKDGFQTPPLRLKHILILSRQGVLEASLEMAILIDTLQDEPLEESELLDEVSVPLEKRPMFQKALAELLHHAAVIRV